MEEEWTQCEDCKNFNHKITFLFLKQVILNYKAQAKALNIKEHSEGVDFYFANRVRANRFCSFNS